jgi:hypothetical protein
MRTIGSGLQKVMADAVRRLPPEESPLLAWPLACGSDVAEKTRPIGYEGGVLTVEVPDAGWRSQLSSLATQYKSLLKGYTGQEIEKIDFVIANRK